MNLEIANRLVALRKENHLSQEALAERLGISRQAVSKWERAEASPDTDNLIALAKLYHISLDELLKIQEEANEDENTQDGEENKSGSRTGYGTDDGRSDEPVVQTEEYTGDETHIGFRGIHVREHNGDEVHIGWDGIHVHSSKDEVHIDRNGICVNGEKVGRHMFTRGKERPEFPLWLLAIIIYIVIGVFRNLWTTGWLIFLLVPVVSSLIRAVRRRNGYLFAYPVFVVFIYLYVGLVHSIWYPTGVIFLTIPLYYSLLRYIGWRDDEEEE